jgi:hypothetical protein
VNSLNIGSVNNREVWEIFTLTTILT